MLLHKMSYCIEFVVKYTIYLFKDLKTFYIYLKRKLWSQRSINLISKEVNKKFILKSPHHCHCLIIESLYSDYT